MLILYVPMMHEGTRSLTKCSFTSLFPVVLNHGGKEHRPVTIDLQRIKAVLLVCLLIVEIK